MTNSHDEPKTAESTDDQAHKHGMIEEMRDKLEAGWDTVKSTVRARFHKLTVEDLELNEIKGKLDELVHRIATRYGYDDTRAREELSRFLSPSDKGEETKAEEPKAEASATESPEAPKAEAAKDDSAKDDSAKDDSAKAEAPKAEAAKAEAPKVETPKKVSSHKAPARKSGGKAAARKAKAAKPRRKAA